jgi:hypothetical protein
MKQIRTYVVNCLKQNCYEEWCLLGCYAVWLL